MREQYNNYVVPEAKQNVCLWLQSIKEKVLNSGDLKILLQFILTNQNEYC